MLYLISDKETNSKVCVVFTVIYCKALFLAQCAVYLHFFFFSPPCAPGVSPLQHSLLSSEMLKLGFPECIRFVSIPIWRWRVACLCRFMYKLNIFKPRKSLRSVRVHNCIYCHIVYSHCLHSFSSTNTLSL